MRKTREHSSSCENKLTASTETLSEFLDCGRSTAVEIGLAAGAKITVGRRVLWNLSKVKFYLDSLAAGEQ